MILEINTSYGIGSTGRIMRAIGMEAQKKAYDVEYICSNKNDSSGNVTFLQTPFEYKVNNICSRLLSNEGNGSCSNTAKLIKRLESEDVELIHIHNIHGHYINARILFSYIKQKNIPVVWTLHDCWAFTGQCPHFTMTKCDKWKTGCHGCSCYRNYPQYTFDNTKFMWEQKKKWFTGVQNMTIVTPSRWLADLVSESFLKDYPIRVIHNGIDLKIFKPTSSDFREKYAIKKYMILGVAFGWGKKKGLDVFIELRKRLSEEFSIVLVGTNNSVDQALPVNITSIHKTNNTKELAEIYTAADVFVIPTREDNYPIVNMEAISCGTPVVTFETGGSPEMLDQDTGVVVPCDDVNALEDSTRRICEEKPFLVEKCVTKAKVFDQDVRYKEYVNLINGMIG